jgi:capsular polysaccharide biosynthesis protein
MRRALNALILLYPKAWRERYQKEFCALLDDVPPTWRTLFDVFGGAMKMQMESWTPLKIIAAFTAIGMVGAAAYSWTIPDRYASTEVIKFDRRFDGEMRRRVLSIQQMALSRASLARIMYDEGLYPGERSRVPLEEVVEQMRRDINIQSIQSVRGSNEVAFSVSFKGTDPERVREVTRKLAAMFVDAKVGTVLDPANLPTNAGEPRRSRHMVMGLLIGVAAGLLFALFAGLKVWKLAGALGLAGALAGAALAFALPPRFGSMAVLRFEAEDEVAAKGRMRQLFAEITNDASLREVVRQFNLYPGEAGAEGRLREHLHIEAIRNAPAMVIRFEYKDPFTAQKVVSGLIGRLLDESIQSGFRTGAHLEMTIELLDPPSLPLHPVFPNRPMVASSGLFLGLACAVMLKLSRSFRRLSAS